MFFPNEIWTNILGHHASSVVFIESIGIQLRKQYVDDREDICRTKIRFDWRLKQFPFDFSNKKYRFLGYLLSELLYEEICDTYNNCPRLFHRGPRIKKLTCRFTSWHGFEEGQIDFQKQSRVKYYKQTTYQGKCYRIVDYPVKDAERWHLHKYDVKQRILLDTYITKLEHIDEFYNYGPILMYIEIPRDEWDDSDNSSDSD